jgi:hypothetical protein
MGCIPSVDFFCFVGAMNALGQMLASHRRLRTISQHL